MLNSKKSRECLQTPIKPKTLTCTFKIFKNQTTHRIAYIPYAINFREDLILKMNYMKIICEDLLSKNED